VLVPAETTTAADWITDASRRPAYRLGRPVPAVFDACARILHPLWRFEGAIAPTVRWADVAHELGTDVQPTLEWPDLIARYEQLPEHDKTGDWDGSPSIGSLPGIQTQALAEILNQQTQAELWYFAIWEGWAQLDLTLSRAPRVEFPGRGMYLLSGSADDADTDFSDGNMLSSYHSPNLWWPSDRAWIVSTDIDDMVTFVGGTQSCIEAVLSDPRLESTRVARGN
jgi:hypothetical protein